MRNGTFVIPTTGERSHRQFTLRASNNASPSGTQSPSDLLAASAETTSERMRARVEKVKEKAWGAWKWLQSDEGHGVLKCVIAYCLGSMGTFWNPLTNWLGNRDGKHVAATITVYFHPARSFGSMLEADFYAVCAIFYAELISLLSMAVSIAARSHLDFVEVAHAIILVLFVGGGMGFLGFVKARLNSPLVNVATTLTSIAIITVLTKEESIQDGYFSEDKVIQNLKLLLLGVMFTTATNVLVWPVSARRVLRRNMSKSTTALGDKLSLVAKGFLNGSEEDIDTPEWKQINKTYDGSYAVMTRTLREAKFEHYFHGREKLYALDKALYKSIEGVAQAVGGLRSALDTQFTLLKEAPGSSHGEIPNPNPASPRLTRVMSAMMDDARDRLAVINEASEESDPERTAAANKSDPSLNKMPMFRAPSDIFALFIALLGPSMKSLAYTLSETLREPPFGKDPQHEIKDSDQLRESLRDALSLYNQARGNALQELYRSIELGRARSEKIQADIEEVAAACGHFSFTLQAVAEQMDAYLDVLEELRFATETGIRSWDWLKVWRYLRWPKKTDELVVDDPERESLLQPPNRVNSIRRSALPKGIPKEMKKRRDTFNWDAAPNASNITRKLAKMLLSIMRFLAREDVLFGIKVGIGATLWGMFAFIPATRPTYQHWRGEWGMLSFMIVAGMTTGASNTTGTGRFKGTLIGAVCSVISWSVGNGNPVILALCGALVAFGSFYNTLVIKNGPLGRTILLAYNVVVLYSYSISQKVDDDDDDEGGTDPYIFQITFHRVVSVTLGIVWGILVCRLLWPISARQKFREGLSVLYLQLGLIWKRGPLGITLQSNGSMDYIRHGEQAALQRYAFKLEDLRGAAKHEHELRGPFPFEAYGNIMRSTKHILDGFYAMRLITSKRQGLTEGERAVLEFTRDERRALCQRICHVFQVLASCIMLEYPLTDAIPTVERNKDRLLNLIYQFRKEHMAFKLRFPPGSPGSPGPGQAGSEILMTEERDYALLYAYTLVTAQVAEELKRVREEIEGLFGVLHEESLLLE